jgi:CBS domain-containing protein
LDSNCELKQWREKEIPTVSLDHVKLNLFHDQLIKKVVKLATKKVKGEWGIPPAPFTFFVMGSAGRFEQLVWSDQDHGIIFEGEDEENLQYFLKLGAEISEGLLSVGYPLCDGKVMASNSLWCKSSKSWETQVINWLNQQSLESLRYFSTFFDSRVLLGNPQTLLKLKKTAFLRLNQSPELYHRLLENVIHVKKGLGPFGQLLPTLHGEDSGTIQLKQTVFFPYVNSIRLLALKEKITVPSTLSRLQRLPDSYNEIKGFEQDFRKLLNLRLYFQRHVKSYSRVHLLQVDNLTKEEKQELKRMMKRGYKLFDETKVLIERGCPSWL